MMVNNEYCSGCDNDITHKLDNELPHLVHNENCNYVGHLYSHLELDDEDKEMECICEDGVVMIYHPECCSYCVELGYNEYSNFTYLEEET